MGDGLGACPCCGNSLPEGFVPDFNVRTLGQMRGKMSFFLEQEGCSKKWIAKEVKRWSPNVLNDNLVKAHKRAIHVECITLAKKAANLARDGEWDKYDNVMNFLNPILRRFGMEEFSIHQLITQTISKAVYDSKYLKYK